MEYLNNKIIVTFTVLLFLFASCARNAQPKDEVLLRRLAGAIQLYMNEFHEFPHNGGVFEVYRLNGGNERGLIFLRDDDIQFIVTSSDWHFFKDSWGNPVEVTFGKNHFVIRSFGRDGKPQIGSRSDDVEVRFEFVKPVIKQENASGV